MPKANNYSIFNFIIHSFKLYHYESAKNRFFCKNSIYTFFELHVSLNGIDYYFA